MRSMAHHQKTRQERSDGESGGSQEPYRSERAAWFQGLVLLRPQLGDRRYQPIACLGDGLDIARFAWIVLEDLAELGDRVGENLVRNKRARPDPIQDGFF